jgi:hypothetical protein
MFEDGDVYERQVRLPEVGIEGQARLGQARVVVAARGGGVHAITYLARAGVGSAALDARLPGAFPHASHFRHAAPRELGCGAWRALDAIARLLERRP